MPLINIEYDYKELDKRWRTPNKVIKRCLNVRNKIRILADHLRLFTFIGSQNIIYIFYNTISFIIIILMFENNNREFK